VALRRIAPRIAHCITAGFCVLAAHAFGQGVSTESRVVVSATRSEQRPFELPAAIDSVTSDQLQLFQPKVNLSRP
jgi:outer membrane receptor protein involved in Fe transport